MTDFDSFQPAALDFVEHGNEKAKARLYCGNCFDILGELPHFDAIIKESKRIGWIDRIGENRRK